jgi:hypothetical protein
MKFTLPSLSLVSCCAPFPCIGTLKVTWKYTRGWSTHSKIKLYGVARNAGTCLYMVWTGVGCLMQCINSIVWNKNMINRAPAYCDICMSFYALSFVRSLFVTPQQSIFNLRSMLHYQRLHFASIASSIRLLG